MNFPFTICAGLLGVAGIIPIALGAAADSAQMVRGKDLYQKHCLICHQASGQGAAGVFPPLAKSDFLLADKARSIRVLCEGLNQKITVNGTEYNNAMPPVALRDAEVADVRTVQMTLDETLVRDVDRAVKRLGMT